MLFAQRANWELTENRISQIRKDLDKKGKEVLDLTISNPSRCDFIYSKEKICKALSREENMAYTPSALGLFSAREAVSHYYAKKNVFVDPSNIILTASTSEAYAFLFRLLADAGEGVIFPRPSYPLFDFLVGLNDLKMQTYSLVYEKDKWAIDFKSLEANIASNTKALVVVHPNNPTGSFLNPKEIQTLNDICSQRNIPIICDEVFEDYAFEEEATFPSLIGNKKNLTFVLGGLSKTLGLPQMKVSWIILNGPEDLVRAARMRLEVITDTYLSVNTPAQNALSDWFDEREPIQKEIKKRIRNNRRFMKEAAYKQTGCECLNADGGWYSVLRIPEKFREETFIIELLVQKQIFVHPGYFFDFSDEPYIVLSLLIQENIFREGISRILQSIH